MSNKYYYHYNFFDIQKEKKLDKSNLTILNHFPTYQQNYDYTCGPCCALMVLNFFKIYDYNELQITSKMKSRPFPYGTKLKNIVNFFKKYYQEQFIIKSSIEMKRDKNDLCFPDFNDFKKFIVQNLKNNSPIIVENVDYGGHYKVIIGYDDFGGDQDMLIFADPSDINDGKCDGYNYFPADRFYYMWFDDHCLEKKYRKQPFCVITKK